MRQNKFDLPINGKISILPSDNGKIRISDLEDNTFYFLLREQDIKPDFTGAAEGDKFPLKITEGALVELHYKSLIHSFKNSADEKSFYLNTNDEKLVFLENEAVSSEMQSCGARTSGFYKLKCCNSDHHFKGFIVPPMPCPGMPFPKECCSGVADTHTDEL